MTATIFFNDGSQPRGLRNVEEVSKAFMPGRWIAVHFSDIDLPAKYFEAEPIERIEIRV